MRARTATIGLQSPIHHPVLIAYTLVAQLALALQMILLGTAVYPYVA